MNRLPLLVLLTVSSGCPCDGTEDLPKCTPVADGAFAPADGSQAVADMRTALQVQPNPALQGRFLRDHCQTKWEDIVETTHCNGVIAAYCENDCPEKARPNCRSGRGHEGVMDECREQSLPVFAREYPPCRGFILCRNRLEPAGFQCPR